MEIRAVDILTEKLESWLRAAVSLLPNLVAALLVILLFALLGRLVRNVVGRGLRRMVANRAVANLIATAAHIAVLLAGLFVALGILELEKTVTSLLAGAGIIGLALAFAFQDAAENLVSGVVLSVQRPIQVGDLVETNSYFGTVEDISLRVTTVRQPEGPLVLIPNKSIFQNPLINFSRLGRRRVDLSVGVTYGEDLRRAREVVLAAASAIEGIEQSTPVEVYFTGFGESSIDLVVRFWVGTTGQADWLAVRSEAVMAIKEAFDAAGITIPFPIRTLDFGAVGGVTLGEVLPQAVGTRRSG